MVPDIPEEVEIKIKREHYMAKEALAENQVTFIETIDGCNLKIYIRINNNNILI